MTNTVATTTAETQGPDLGDDLRDSAKAGQHAASQALRKFRHTVDEVVPEAVQPLRNKIVDAAIELADDLVSAQYEFHRSLLKTANKALRPDTKDN